jgi:trk system potassium uptake protein TrkH
MLAPLVVALIFSETDLTLLLSFILPAAFSLILGYYLIKTIKVKELSWRSAIFVAALSWLLIPLIGCIPFIFVTKLSFIDAFFDSMSGFTTTGLTMINNVETCPNTILFWRSLIQWVGGVGVIVLFLSILAGSGTAAVKLYIAEAHRERITPNIIGTVRRIWWIYVFYTCIGVLLLFLAGMPLFDAINHCMCGLATGGFSIKNSSIGAYNNSYIEIAVVVIMILGSISFATHYYLLRRHFKAVIKNAELRLMFFIIILCTFLLSIFLITTGTYSELDSLRTSFFQVTSALSGTGFTTINISNLGDFAKVLLTLLMIIGGGYGSTSGAVKLIRSVVMLKAIRLYLKKYLLPEGAVVQLKIQDRIIEEAEILEAFRFSVLYIIFLGFGTFVLMALGYPFVNSMFEAASAQGNVGLSAGITSVDLHIIGKIVLIFEMWAGRLEIIPFLVILVHGLSSISRKFTKSS